MAELVLALGTSHSPLVALDALGWEARSKNDRVNKHLFDADGSVLSYEELAHRAADQHVARASISVFAQQKALVRHSLDRLAADIEAARPDVVVIIGDDEHELFSSANMPALSIYHGAHAVTRIMLRESDPEKHDPEWAWAQDVAPVYGMETNVQLPLSPEVALALIASLMDEGFDVAAGDHVPDPERAAFGHAFGFVFTRLLDRRAVPIVPILLNTYYPPNQPTPKRCYALGVALRKAIAGLPDGMRVALVASGGLSHFVTNEPLDRIIVEALQSGDFEAMCAIPTSALQSGSSEIRCWIALAGALRDLHLDWLEYVPVYRTPAGTGIGMAFASWSNPHVTDAPAMAPASQVSAKT